MKPPLYTEGEITINFSLRSDWNEDENGWDADPEIELTELNWRVTKDNRLMVSWQSLPKKARLEIAREVELRIAELKTARQLEAAEAREP